MPPRGGISDEDREKLDIWLQCWEGHDTDPLSAPPAGRWLWRRELQHGIRNRDQ